MDKFNFVTTVTMKLDAQQVNEVVPFLKSIGYVDSHFTCYTKENPWLVLRRGEILFNQTRLSEYIEVRDIKVLIALASMTDREIPLESEYYIGREGYLPTHIRHYMQDPLGWKNKFYRKATIEEIMDPANFKYLKPLSYFFYEAQEISRSDLRGIFDCVPSTWKYLLIKEARKSDPTSEVVTLGGEFVKKLYKNVSSLQRKVLKKFLKVPSLYECPFKQSFKHSFVDAMSIELFGDSSLFQLCAGAADRINRPDLEYKAFYVKSGIEVVTHPLDDGEGTVIELIKTNLKD